MKKALLTVILSIQVVIIASMPASSLVAASAIDDTVTKVAFKIDPRTFSGVKNDFHYHSNPAAAGKLGCLGIRNIEGVLEVFNIEVEWCRQMMCLAYHH